MSKRRKVQREFVDAVVRHTVDVMRSHASTRAISESDARESGNEIARRICGQYAKTIMYVPSTMTWDITERDQSVFAAYSRRGTSGTPAFSRDRCQEVAREHDLSPAYVYQIVRLVNEDLHRDRQAILPLENASSATPE